MKKKIIKPNASLGTTCIAGWENKEIEEYLDMVEKDLKLLAKKYKLEISVFVQVFKV